MRAELRHRRPPVYMTALWLALTMTGVGLLGGCESIPKKLADLPLVSKFAPSLPSPVAALPPPVERTWPASGQDELNQRARGFGLVNAPDMERYLNGLYTRIKTQAGVKDWPGRVHILANHSLQAYATGAGNLYVSLPWLSSAQSEDELAALLSHEFGHIYLHYHQLEGAVADADTAAGVLAIGVSIARKTAQATGWTQVDSLVAVYTLGRALATTVYSRSQESAADNFGLNLSLKLGYSYEHGMKAVLERMASWEEKNELREKEQQEQVIKALREQTEKDIFRQNPGPKTAAGQSFLQAQSDLNAGFNGALQQLTFDIKGIAKKMGSDHPVTVERIDTLAAAVGGLPGFQDKEPTSLPLDRVRQERRTAALLANYAAAFEVIIAPKDTKALQLARQASSGVTATHAVPLFALYTALNEQPAAARGQRADPGVVLEANFRSEPDRAWKIYQERSSKLQDARQTAAAKKVMDEGLAYFHGAAEPWPQAIRFYGETQGWNEAKKMAQDCGKSFRSMAARCHQAAASPAELAEADRKAKEKGDQIGKRLFKTP